LLSRYSDGQWAERPRFDYRQGQEIIPLSTASRPVQGHTQPPVRWVLEALSPGIKRKVRETDHSPTSSADLKNDGAKPPLSPYVSMS
jgi:hypothetical protein